MSKRANDVGERRRSRFARAVVVAMTAVVLASAAILGLTRIHQPARTRPSLSRSEGIAVVGVTARAVPTAVVSPPSPAVTPTAPAPAPTAKHTPTPTPPPVPRRKSTPTPVRTVAPVRDCSPSDFHLTASAPAQPDPYSVGRWLMVKTSPGSCLLQHWEVFLHLTDDQGVSPPGFPYGDGNGVGDAEAPYVISQGYSIPGPLKTGPHTSVPAGTYSLWATCNIFGTSAAVSDTLQ